jgi:hypothetical protein
MNEETLVSEEIVLKKGWLFLLGHDRPQGLKAKNRRAQSRILRLQIESKLDSWTQRVLRVVVASLVLPWLAMILTRRPFSKRASLLLDRLVLFIEE